MRTWKDEQGREWKLFITLPVIEDLRQRFQIDVVSWDDPPFDKLYRDPVRLYSVLWHLSESQAAAVGVSAEEFAVGCCGGAFDRGLLALCEASTDFCPERMQSLRRSLLSRAEELSKAAEQRQLVTLADPRLEAKFFEALDAINGGRGAFEVATSTALERLRAKESSTSANASAT